jgi:DNA polymerase-3 subunit beta
MDVVIDQPALGRALRLASRVTPARGAAPILQTVLLATEPARLSLTATDTQLGVTVGLAAESKKCGEVAVPARLLTDFVAHLPAEPLRLALEGGGKRLRATCGLFTATFASVDCKDFPRLPEVDEATAVAVDASAFRDAIERVAFAAARDETRPVLTAVLLEFGREAVNLAATDGFRLARASLPSAADSAEQLLVPARALAEFGRLLTGAKAARLVRVPENRALFLVLQETRLYTRLIEGRFPDIDRVIPGEWRTRLTVETAALRQAVRVAGLFGEGETHPTVLEVEPGKLKLRARGDETGEAESELPVALEGDSQAIAVNARLVGEILDIVRHPQVELAWTSPQAPIVIREKEPSGACDLWVAMPLYDPALARHGAAAA